MQLRGARTILWDSLAAAPQLLFMEAAAAEAHVIWTNHGFLGIEEIEAAC
jgi:hypothetical protein